MTTDSNPAAVAQLREQVRTLEAALEHQTAETRTLRFWIRQDQRTIAQFEDLADQLRALLQTHGHTPENTPILALLQTYKKTHHPLC